MCINVLNCTEIQDAFIYMYVAWEDPRMDFLTLLFWPLRPRKPEFPTITIIREPQPKAHKCCEFRFPGYRESNFVV